MGIKGIVPKIFTLTTTPPAKAENGPSSKRKITEGKDGSKPREMAAIADFKKRPDALDEYDFTHNIQGLTTPPSLNLPANLVAPKITVPTTPEPAPPPRFSERKAETDPELNQPPNYPPPPRPYQPPPNYPAPQPPVATAKPAAPHTVDADQLLETPLTVSNKPSPSRPRKEKSAPPAISTPVTKRPVSRNSTRTGKLTAEARALREAEVKDSSLEKKRPTSLRFERRASIQRSPLDGSRIKRKTIESRPPSRRKEK